MSLDIARSIAVGSLMASQVQISVASSNVSNADTTGYSVKTANQVATTSGGAGTGVSITGITSSVDKLLMKSVIAATSELGAAEIDDTYLDRLQALYGSTSGANDTGTSLANTLASLESAVTSLAGTPSSASLQANVVSALDDLASQLRETSSGIQSLRADADAEIAADVDEVNTALKTIDDLNDQIKQAAASGNSTADLEDQRNVALQTVAGKMNISYFVSSSGDMQVYTSGGQALVDSSAHLLSFTAASSVKASSTYDGTSSGLSGITLNGVDVTSQISSGEIGALFDLRDTELPAAQAQLDQLATTLADSLNTASNAGTSLPPPATLTGTTAVTSSTALSATGIVRIAVADQSGNLVSYGDLDLSSYATVGDLVDGINAISGLSAAIDSSGKLVISATGSGNGVAINEMTGAVGADGAGLSDYFGLNDLVTGTGASNFAVRSDILANSGLFQVTTLDDSATLTTGSKVLTAGSSDVVDGLYSALTESRSFGASGGLGSTTGSFADYAADIVSNVASKATSAATTYTAKSTTQSSLANALTSQSGVNLDEETAKISSLQNQYTAASQLIQVINEMFSSLMTAVQSVG
ncbi:Flagellar hook-associated protein [Rhodopseudomonas palustris HaA2]|uniref:Flagellar hook-associated protein 1 n=1 Tax=Rhodopseudomonas palustris (strain HaA2) TaxID=316058 RepID=Q2J231_RHOP2|nr:flagellar hook-associated protein FlgK [Rhodopseudomonas palustris]ABD05479.1 Flagellar hook-associated protein [Rhodopseudomonas palustris HaA2]